MKRITFAVCLALVLLAVAAGPALASSGLIVFDGNSHTQESPGCYPTQMMALMPGQWAFRNFGVGGQTSTDMSADAATQIDPLLNDGRPLHILVAWEIANDYHVSFAQRMANFWAYCDARKAAGWQVVVLTLIASAGVPEEDRTPINAAVRADWADHADALADVALDPRIGAAGAEYNPTYYVDPWVHMIAAGKAIVAGIVEPVVMSLCPPQPSTVSAPAVRWSGHRIHLAGIVAPRPSPVTVRAYRRRAGTWHVRRHLTAAVTSTGYAASLTIWRPGRYRFRAFMAATAATQASRSGPSRTVWIR